MYSLLHALAEVQQGKLHHGELAVGDDRALTRLAAGVRRWQYLSHLSRVLLEMFKRHAYFMDCFVIM